MTGDSGLFCRRLLAVFAGEATTRNGRFRFNSLGRLNMYKVVLISDQPPYLRKIKDVGRTVKQRRNAVHHRSHPFTLKDDANKKPVIGVMSVYGIFTHRANPDSRDEKTHVRTLRSMNMNTRLPHLAKRRLEWHSRAERPFFITEPLFSSGTLKGVSHHSVSST